MKVHAGFVQTLAGKRNGKIWWTSHVSCVRCLLSFLFLEVFSLGTRVSIASPQKPQCASTHFHFYLDTVDDIRMSLYADFYCYFLTFESITEWYNGHKSMIQVRLHVMVLLRAPLNVYFNFN